MENKKIENILPLVQRPGRYINHEWNSTKKQGGAEVAVCFCFPDMYELGASNLGLEILYHIVNARPDAVAERCYSPAPDMDAVLRAEKMPLFSLETKKPLKDFDIVGFSLQYELCATSVVNMIDLAGLPLEAAKRDESFPLVIGGGPLTANPEPFADFFDAFVLGDGEDVINEIVETIKNLKGKIKNKKELLLALSKIAGVYVPSFYSVTYNEDCTLAAVIATEKGAPEKITRRTVKLDEAFFPAAQIVPFLATVHNRLNIEIARGCPRRCRFCQATRYYGPWRLRSQENILGLLEKGLAATGYEEIALSSLSCTEFRGLDELLNKVNARYMARRINISLPSLRCDRFSLEVAGNLGYNKRSSLTFAPEAGSQRLRDAIGKELSDAEIRETLVLAWNKGWRLVKLYFMVGLPTETNADTAAITELVRSVKRDARGLNFNVTLSPFIPKAQTPFQWAAMTGRDVIKERLRHLEKNLPASVKTHPLDGSMLESVFARGDRRLSHAIIKAWEKGCRFDQWKEHLRPELWAQAFTETGIDTAFYYRERAKDEVLPWDHLVFAADKQSLRADYEKGLNVTESAAAASAVAAMPLPAPARPVPAPNTPLKAAQRVRLKFSRRGEVRFLSHLEQIEVFRRAVRRAELPLVYTAGFHPQPKMAFGPAISVGYESESEYLEVELARRMELSEIKERLDKALPEGFLLTGMKRVPLFFPSFDSLVNVASYEIGVSAAPEQVERFLSQNRIIVQKQKKGNVESVDAKALIRRLEARPDGVYMELRFGPKRNIKPEKIIQQLMALDDNGAKCIAITRKELFVEKKDGSISEP